MTSAFLWTFDPSIATSRTGPSAASRYYCASAVCPREYASSQTGRSVTALCIVMRWCRWHAGRTDSPSLLERRSFHNRVGRKGCPREAKLDARINRSTRFPLKHPSRNRPHFFPDRNRRSRDRAMADARALLAESTSSGQPSGFPWRLPSRCRKNWPPSASPSVSKTARKRRSGSSRRHAAPT